MAVVGAIGAAQYQQQGAYGKFNEAKNNRDALVKEQNAETDLILVESLMIQF